MIYCPRKGARAPRRTQGRETGQRHNNIKEMLLDSRSRLIAAYADNSGKIKNSCIPTRSGACLTRPVALRIALAILAGRY